MGKFELKYIGCTTVFSGKTSLGGVKDEKDMFLKVCTRAVDGSISELQKSSDEFKVYMPLVSTQPLCAYIGLKEGVDEDSRFEVLETVVDNDSRTRYEKVGEITPVKGQIWDNRFMAVDDPEVGSDLSCTTFKKVSGEGFLSGYADKGGKIGRGPHSVCSYFPLCSQASQGAVVRPVRVHYDLARRRCA